MKKIISLGILILIFCLSITVQAQENEKICSQRNDFCFQIPPNHFMLTTNDIESASVSYKTVDGSSTIEIVNGNLSDGCDMHKLYLMTLSQWTTNNYRLTLKKEYADFSLKNDGLVSLFSGAIHQTPRDELIGMVLVNNELFNISS